MMPMELIFIRSDFMVIPVWLMQRTKESLRDSSTIVVRYGINRWWSWSSNCCIEQYDIPRRNHDWLQFKGRRGNPMQLSKAGLQGTSMMCHAFWCTYDTFIYIIMWWNFLWLEKKSIAMSQAMERPCSGRHMVIEFYVKNMPNEMSFFLAWSQREEESTLVNPIQINMRRIDLSLSVC